MFNQELVDIVLSGDPIKRRYVCGKDFRYFFLYYYSDYIKYPFADFHFEIFDSLADLTDNKIRELALIMFREAGKRQPLSAKLLTPNGFKKLGDLNVGDYVIGSDGKKTEIVYMSEIVNRPIYEIKTEDGRVTQCDDEHYWTIRMMSNQRITKKRTVTLRQMIDSGLYYERFDKRVNKTYKEYKYALETVKPVELDEQKLSLDPYLVGAILGDGHISSGGTTNITFHKDDEIHYRTNFSKYDLSESWYDKRNLNVGCFTIRKIFKETKELGINVNSHHKFIPDIYKNGSIEQRKAVLEGLMDTDGTCSKGNASFCSVSEKLANDVVDIVRSLGGRARKTKKIQGECTSYAVSIIFSDYTPFRLERKKKKHRLSHRTFSRIVDIKYIGEELGRCIKVSNEDGLYVTDDYILTHNTSIIKPYLTWVILYNKYKYILVDSYEKQNSEKILTDVMNQLLTNKRILSDFGRVISVKKDKDDDEKKPKRVSNFVTDTGIMVEAVSTQESVRGRLHKSFRPDLLIADDFENNKTKDSERVTDKIIDHFNEALTAMDARGAVIYLGNYITDRGSVQWVMNRGSTDAKIKILNIPLLDKNNNPTWSNKYALTEQEALKTGKISIEEIQQKVAPSVFQVEYMNNPYAQDGSIFKKEWFKYCKQSEVDARIDMSVYITIDTSTAEGKDYTGVVINFVDSTNKWHIRCERLKIDAGKLVDNLFSWYNVYKPVYIGIEKTTYTMGFQPSLELEQRKRGIFLPIVELKHGGKKKEERIKDNLEYRYANNGIVHIEGTTKELEDELLKFPFGVHDDLVDALSYQAQVSETYQPVKVTETKMYV